MRNGPAATLSIEDLTKIADSSGTVVFPSIAAGNYDLHVSYSGMKEQTIKITIPQPDNNPLIVDLEPHEEQEEIIVTSTRGSNFRIYGRKIPGAFFRFYKF